MKLRIQGSSIRLRLKQAEVTALGRDGRVTDHTELPGGLRFSYLLEPADVQAVAVEWQERELRVRIPRPAAEEWVGSEQVGIEASIATQGSDDLRVLIEKDFKCLHKRPGEDESDNYPHPAESES